MGSQYFPRKGVNFTDNMKLILLLSFLGMNQHILENPWSVQHLPDGGTWEGELFACLESEKGEVLPVSLFRTNSE